MSAAVGDELSRFRLPVDASKAREMALALHASGWADADPGALRGRAVVPTFTAASGHWQDRRALMTGTLGLDLARVLHGEQRWRYHRPARVGEILDGVTTLAGVAEREGRRGGRMRLLTLRTSYASAGDPVLDEEMLLIETAAAGAGSVPPPAAGPSRAPAVAPPAPERAPAAQRSGAAPAGEPPGPPLAAPWELPAIDRTDLVRYAGASGDFNPLHHDEPYAREHGLPSVLAMGMLVGGMVGTYVADRAPGATLSALAIRFRDRVWPGERLTIHGWWTAARTACELEARAGDGRVVVSGTATPARPHRSAG